MELVALNVNGRTYNIAVEKNWTLLYTLREVMDLTGTKLSLIHICYKTIVWEGGLK